MDFIVFCLALLALFYVLILISAKDAEPFQNVEDYE